MKCCGRNFCVGEWRRREWDAFVTAREEACYAAADRITVPSRVAMRSFVERGVAAEKIKVIPYGVRLERFQKVADSAG